MPCVGELAQFVVEPDGLIGMYLGSPWAQTVPPYNYTDLKHGDYALILEHDKGYYYVLTKIGPGWVDRVFF